ncbi:L,D-transpeptidase [Actinosynnema sp. NPDC023587]|uniref:L,D-transpeptidase n=1 Tax=Actinosynnema sp. NPDC023587 TaxID=3154695 RepID=UPI0033FAF9BB
MLRSLLLAAVSALAVTSCAGTPDPPPPPPPAPTAVDVRSFEALPEATTFAEIDGLPRDDDTSPTAGQVLRAVKAVPVYDRPDGEAVARLPGTQLGSPTWVPEIARRDGWSQVLLPVRPNRSSGWVFTGSGDFERAENDFLVTVDLAAFRLDVSEKGRSRGTWTVGTGKPEYPTPTGRTYLMASIRETVTTFSPHILPLGAHSDSHETFGGGPGTVALHGWPDASPFGVAGSDGCIRVPDDALDLLLTLPLGTVVIVK